MESYTTNNSSSTSSKKKWHHYLPLHPIFKQDIHIENDTKKKSSLKVIERLRGKRSCIVTAAKLLFVAVGNQIRVLNISDFYYAWFKACENGELEQTEAWMQNAKYLTLKTPAINFQIYALVMNYAEKSNFIAVVGVSELAVIKLKEDIPNYSEMSCTTHLVGPFHHVIGGSPICKVLWHSLSRNGSHLMVLTTDGNLRMYDIFTNYNEPIQVFQVVESSKTRNGYGCNLDDEPEAASFCFGQSASNIWGPFTVYILMKNSDIYSFCPVTPDKMTCQVSHLQKLASLISSNCQKVIPGIKGKEKYGDISWVHQRQLEWISKITSQIPEGCEPDKKVDIDLTSNIHGQPQRQGPYLLQPSPIELSLMDCPDASDILCLNTKYMNVFVLVFEHGKVDICLEDDKVQGCWKNPDYLCSQENQYPRLIVYECIDLGLSKPFRQRTVSSVKDKTMLLDPPSLLPDLNYRDTFYVYHAAGAHAIIIRKWLEKINRLLGDGLHDDDLDDEDTRSEVRWLATTNPTTTPDPIIGFCVMNHLLLGFFMFIVTAGGQMWSHELTTRKSIKQKNLEDENTSTIRPTPSKLPAYAKTTIPDFINKYISYQGLPRQPFILPSGGRSSPYNYQNSGATASLYQKIIKDYKKEIFEILEGVKYFQERCMSHMQDVQRQHNDLLKYENECQEIDHKFKHITMERLDKIKDRQEEITKRVSALFQELWYDQLSIYDDLGKKDVRELGEISKENEDVKLKVQKLVAQNNSLLNDYKLLSFPHQKNETFTRSARMQLQKAVSEETKLVSETKERIEEMSQQLSQLVISGAVKGDHNSLESDDMVISKQATAK
ncbi:786_t:CDS:10 [Ambispora gerdemannii]|uniref:786_t:CDS:1 n=1 Tax=Ambispora gerdemannii TaxID=144530 RepID=A0A9N8VH52_9GLOM|nr:786_t:CDS:10 [Ambispora gerdemannii]